MDWLRQRTRPKDARVAVGIGDDMAAVRWPSGPVLITCDIRLDAVVHDDARRPSERDGVSPLEHALHDGEDFELVVVGDERGLEPLAAKGQLLRIGRITEAGGMRLHDGEQE